MPVEYASRRPRGPQYPWHPTDNPGGFSDLPPGRSMMVWDSTDYAAHPGRPDSHLHPVSGFDKGVDGHIMKTSDGSYVEVFPQGRNGYRAAVYPDREAYFGDEWMDLIFPPMPADELYREMLARRWIDRVDAPPPRLEDLDLPENYARTDYGDDEIRGMFRDLMSPQHARTRAGLPGGDQNFRLALSDMLRDDDRERESNIVAAPDEHVVAMPNLASVVRGTGGVEQARERFNYLTGLMHGFDPEGDWISPEEAGALEITQGDLNPAIDSGHTRLIFPPHWAGLYFDPYELLDMGFGDPLEPEELFRGVGFVRNQDLGPLLANMSGYPNVGDVYWRPRNIPLLRNAFGRLFDTSGFEVPDVNNPYHPYARYARADAATHYADEAGLAHMLAQLSDPAMNITRWGRPEGDQNFRLALAGMLEDLGREEEAALVAAGHHLLNDNGVVRRGRFGPSNLNAVQQAIMQELIHAGVAGEEYEDGIYDVRPVRSVTPADPGRSYWEVVNTLTGDSNLIFHHDDIPSFLADEYRHWIPNWLDDALGVFDMDPELQAGLPTMDHLHPIIDRFLTASMEEPDDTPYAAAPRSHVPDLYSRPLPVAGEAVGAHAQHQSPFLATPMMYGAFGRVPPGEMNLPDRPSDDVNARMARMREIIADWYERASLHGIATGDGSPQPFEIFRSTWGAPWGPMMLGTRHGENVLQNYDPKMHRGDVAAAFDFVNQYPMPSWEELGDGGEEEPGDYAAYSATQYLAHPGRPDSHLHPASGFTHGGLFSWIKDPNGLRTEVGGPYDGGVWDADTMLSPLIGNHLETFRDFPSKEELYRELLHSGAISRRDVPPPRFEDLDLPENYGRADYVWHKNKPDRFSHPESGFADEMGDGSYWVFRDRGQGLHSVAERRGDAWSGRSYLQGEGGVGIIGDALWRGLESTEEELFRKMIEEGIFPQPVGTPPRLEDLDLDQHSATRPPTPYLEHWSKPKEFADPRLGMKQGTFGDSWVAPSDDPNMRTSVFRSTHPEFWTGSTLVKEPGQGWMDSVQLLGHPPHSEEAMIRRLMREGLVPRDHPVRWEDVTSDVNPDSAVDPRDAYPTMNARTSYAMPWDQGGKPAPGFEPDPIYPPGIFPPESGPPCGFGAGYPPAQPYARVDYAGPSSIHEWLREIDANPLDAAGHHAFADWLEEQGATDEAEFQRNIANWMQGFIGKRGPYLESDPSFIPPHYPEAMFGAGGALGFPEGVLSDDPSNPFAFFDLPPAREGQPGWFEQRWQNPGRPGHIPDFSHMPYPIPQEGFVPDNLFHWVGYPNMEQALRRAFHAKKAATVLQPTEHDPNEPFPGMGPAGERYARTNYLAHPGRPDSPMNDPRFKRIPSTSTWAHKTEYPNGEALVTEASPVGGWHTVGGTGLPSWGYTTSIGPSYEILEEQEGFPTKEHLYRHLLHAGIIPRADVPPPNLEDLDLDSIRMSRYAFNYDGFNQDDPYSNPMSGQPQDTYPYAGPQGQGGFGGAGYPGQQPAGMPSAGMMPGQPYPGQQGMMPAGAPTMNPASVNPPGAQPAMPPAPPQPAFDQSGQPMPQMYGDIYEDLLRQENEAKFQRKYQEWLRRFGGRATDIEKAVRPEGTPGGFPYSSDDDPEMYDAFCSYMEHCGHQYGDPEDLYDLFREVYAAHCGSTMYAEQTLGPSAPQTFDAPVGTYTYRGTPDQGVW